MTSPALRTRYLNDSVNTASPGRLLVMLYDRLILDLARGEEALIAGSRESASRHLMHAQDIILELHSALDATAWPGAAGLGALYTFLTTELISANVHGNARQAATVRDLVEPLRDAWRNAAMASAGATAHVA